MDSRVLAMTVALTETHLYGGEFQNGAGVGVVDEADFGAVDMYLY
jgi:uncharacterized membrane protein